MVRIISLLTLGLFFLYGCNQAPTKSMNENPYISSIAENLDDYPVRVLSFHTTSRCPTCLTIEKLVRETVLAEYKDQLEKGKLRLFIMNVEKSENRQTAEIYHAYGSALFISSGQGENIRISDLTNDAFMYAVNNTDRFLEILRSSINQHIQ